MFKALPTNEQAKTIVWLLGKVTNMDKVFGWIMAHKTLCTVIVAMVCAGLQASGIPIPEWFWAVLGAAGLGFLRSGVTTEVKKATTAANEATDEASLTDKEKK
jgi:hypothetical protein